MFGRCFEGLETHRQLGEAEVPAFNNDTVDWDDIPKEGEPVKKEYWDDIPKEGEPEEQEQWDIPEF